MSTSKRLTDAKEAMMTAVRAFRTQSERVLKAELELTDARQDREAAFRTLHEAGDELEAAMQEVGPT